MSVSESVLWGQIDGVEVTFPVEVADANIATMTFTVPSKAASALLPGEEFEVLESVPGSATLVIALCDYVDNPWGDYNEINLGILAKPTAPAVDGDSGSFVYRMPVDQEFTCKAGNAVMGFPKTVEEIDVGYSDSSVEFVLRCDGVEALRIRLPRAAALGEAERITADTYSYLDGVAYVTPLAMDMGTGFVDGSEVMISLGEGEVARELASLGLPKPPEFCSWGEGLSATFQLGHPL